MGVGVGTLHLLLVVMSTSATSSMVSMEIAQTAEDRSSHPTPGNGSKESEIYIEERCLKPHVS